MSDLKRFWRSVHEFGAKRGEGRGLRGQEGTHHHLLKGNLKLATTDRGNDFSDVSRNKQGWGEEKVREKGGLKIRKGTNEERKLYEMYTEGREKKGSKKCV